MVGGCRLLFVVVVLTSLLQSRRQLISCCEIDQVGVVGPRSGIVGGWWKVRIAGERSQRFGCGVIDDDQGTCFFMLGRFWRQLQTAQCFGSTA